MIGPIGLPEAYSSARLCQRALILCTVQYLVNPVDKDILHASRVSIAGKRVVQALFNYEPPEGDDLRFDEGDFMTILAE